MSRKRSRAGMLANCALAVVGRRSPSAAAFQSVLRLQWSPRRPWLEVRTDPASESVGGNLSCASGRVLTAIVLSR